MSASSPAPRLTSRRSLRWAPGVLVPALVLAGIVAVPLQAGAAVSLPDKTPAEILLMAGDSADTAYSGTVVTSADLGLPAIDFSGGFSPSQVDAVSGEMPDGAATAAMDGAVGDALGAALDLLSGSQTARVWVDPTTGLRVQVQDTMAERTLVANADQIWTFDSRTNAATVTEIPDSAGATAQEKLEELKAEMPVTTLTPAEALAQVLDGASESTDIVAADNVRVAGRSAYQLVATPRDASTLLESISFAIDSESGLPLRLVVRAVGQEAPAFEVGFSEFSPGTPEASLFAFTPPPAATVERRDAPVTPPAGMNPEMRAGMHSDSDLLPRLIGSGWDAVIEADLEGASSDLAESGLLAMLATPVDGGLAVSTALFTVLLTDDGRLYSGAVSLDQLRTAAGL